MKKQYLAQVKFRKDDNWTNAKVIMGGTRNRYCDSIEEAEMYIKQAVKHFNHGARVETSTVAGFGVSTVIDEATAKRLEIVATRIKVREVSDWTVC